MVHIVVRPHDVPASVDPEVSGDVTAKGTDRRGREVLCCCKLAGASQKAVLSIVAALPLGVFSRFLASTMGGMLSRPLSIPTIASESILTRSARFERKRSHLPACGPTVLVEPQKQKHGLCTNRETDRLHWQTTRIPFGSYSQRYWKPGYRHIPSLHDQRP